MEFETKPHTARVTSVSYNDTGRYMFTGSADASIKVEY